MAVAKFYYSAKGKSDEKSLGRKERSLEHYLNNVLSGSSFVISNGESIRFENATAGSAALGIDPNDQTALRLRLGGDPTAMDTFRIETTADTEQFAIDKTSMRVYCTSGIGIRDSQPVIDFRDAAGSVTGRWSVFASGVGGTGTSLNFYSNEIAAYAMQLFAAIPYVRLKHTTTLSAANCYITTAGGIYRSTASSRRYKKNIKDLVPVGSLRPRSFKYKAGYVDDDPKGEQTHWYFIAEEVFDEFGVSAVELDDDGQPEDVRVKAIVAILAHKLNRLETLLEVA